MNRIDQLLADDGVDETCMDCQYYVEDRDVNFFGCEARLESDCPRLPDVGADLDE